MSLGVPFPHAWHMTGDGISGIEGHSLSGIVSQYTEHGTELRDIALQNNKEKSIIHSSVWYNTCCKRQNIQTM